MNPHHHRSTLFPVCKSCVLITRLVFFILGTALILSAIPAQAQSEAGRQTYAIPAGTLKSVLVSFGQANGVMISYTESEIAGKRSSGIHGSFTDRYWTGSKQTGGGWLQAAPANASHNRPDITADDGECIG